MRYATNDTKKILQLQYQKYLNEISGIFKLEKSRNIADFYYLDILKVVKYILKTSTDSHPKFL